MFVAICQPGCFSSADAYEDEQEEQQQTGAAQQPVADKASETQLDGAQQAGGKKIIDLTKSSNRVSGMQPAVD